MVEVTNEGMLILCGRAKEYYNLQLIELRKEILELARYKHANRRAKGSPEEVP